MADFNFNFKPGGPELKEFMKDDSFFRGLRGPVGSGKSVGCCVEIFRRALLQQPSPLDGVRRSRWGVIRNTGPQLKTTTIKTWLEWYPEENFGPFRWGVPYTHHIKYADLDCEVIFLALDDADDVKKLLSLEFTGIFVNEAREVIKTIIDACTMRVGRYPSMKHGGPSWYGVICDTNAPEDDHWWPIMAGEAPLPEFISDEDALMLRKPEGWRFFRQPGAMREIRNEDEKLLGYEMNPEAENLDNLVPDYYEKIITGKARDWIQVYVLNELGSVSEGKAVYKSYREEVHKAHDMLDVHPGRTLYVGVDFGLSPAAVFGQKLGNGRWQILEEIVADDMSTPAFIREIKLVLGQLLVSERQQFKVYGDPTGDTRTASTEDKTTSIKIARAGGLTIFPAPTNDPLKRIETVKQVVDRMVDGGAGVLVSPSCHTLLKGFASGYCYRQLTTGGVPRYEAKPSKNKYSHVHDALQYLLLGAGEGRELVRVQGIDTKPKIAKTRWNPFRHNKNRKQTRSGLR